MAQVWAIETADYPALYARPLEELEAPNSPDYQIEYYEDGYPKLPSVPGTVGPNTRTVFGRNQRP